MEQALLPPGATVRQALAKLTYHTEIPLLMVVNENRQLLGVVVDYDIRRALLAGKNLDSPVEEIMNVSPDVLPGHIDMDGLRRFFEKGDRRAVPLVDAAGCVTGLGLRHQVLQEPTPVPNLVVLMAGGFGKRLRPLTNNIPKPMVPVGDKPLLQITLERFLAQGFRDFMISVHYLAEQIKDHFGDGSRFGARIQYLEETTPLGTAGALSLLPCPPQSPLIMMNADLLTKVNFRLLLDFHLASGHLATVGVREHTIEVPFGVIQVEGTTMQDLVEKPVYRMLVNAGIYVLEPEVVGMVTPGERLDTTDLLERVRQAHPQKRPVGCFPIEEYWLDVGQPQDHQKAQSDYPAFCSEK